MTQDRVLLSQLVLSGSTSFPKSSLSEFRKPGTHSEFYLLDALDDAWLLIEAPGADYMKQLREHARLDCPLGSSVLRSENMSQIG